ncbi:MAG: NAD(+) synthase [Desulfitobacterium sp.]|nr:NAD(+) synthase [Desulfitobacterium sp.]
MWNKEQLEERINQTVEWLREKVQGAKSKGLVVGISGGVDSAVVAGLCKRAFPDNSVGVILPAASSSADVEDAHLVARTLSIKTLEVDLTEAHQMIISKVYEGMKGKSLPFEEKLTQGNLKARIRMATLYTVANSLNYLVVGTDNVSEYYTGYFTKYGDGGVDLLPISSLTKAEVKAWAAHMGLPDSIVNRVPSAGLWEGQTDEEEMGITYDMIDRYLIGEKIPEDVAAKIEAMHKASEHKRQLPPTLELPKLPKL